MHVLLVDRQAKRGHRFTTPVIPKEILESYLGQSPAREAVLHAARSLLAPSRTTSFAPLTLWSPKKGTTFGCRSCRSVPISFSAACRRRPTAEEENDTKMFETFCVRPHTRAKRGWGFDRDTDASSRRF